MIKHTAKAKLTRKKKLVTKIFEMKRADIVAALDQLADRIDCIDAHDTSPNAMDEELSELRSDIVSLAAQVTDERF